MSHFGQYFLILAFYTRRCSKQTLYQSFLNLLRFDEITGRQISHEIYFLWSSLVEGDKGLYRSANVISF